jgi:sortase (surface protein transpeptidase)
VGLTPPTTRQRRRIAAALLLSGCALLAVFLVRSLTRPTDSATLDTKAQLERILPVPHPAPARQKQRLRTMQPARVRWGQQPRPVRLLIPAIGVSAPIVRLGLNSDGSAATPDTVTDTGWFAPGPEPGERGAALIIGHVDSYRGPGVFYHLRALRPGDRITVVLRNSRRARFVVTGAKEASKTRFPTSLVFAQTARPTLRLVTCGGTFDRSTGHYVDNYIVFAHLVTRA